MQTKYLPLVLLLLLGGCVILFRHPEARELAPPTERAASVTVDSPVRAHLLDGRVVLFRNGAIFSADSLFGAGTVYSLSMEEAGTVRSLALDRVAAFETFENKYEPAKSLFVSTLATGAVAAITPALLVAIFGSCPTVYTQGPDSLRLEAESFANSIAPLFEVRDVDLLRVQPDEAGVVELEIRNEALETHYINHLELLEVRHAEDQVALPTRGGEALLLRRREPPESATDRAGNEVLAALRAHDTSAFRTDERTLRAATPEDLTDYIDLAFPMPAADTAAVVLRLRNSLLNTVYFYDEMLARQGPDALDWLGRDLASIRNAIALGDYFNQRMGLRVQVWDGAAYREVGKAGEVGPIAWDEVAVPFAVPPAAKAASADRLRIRLHFVADAWRIDQVAMAGEVRRVQPRRIPLAAVRTHEAPDDAQIKKRLAASDEEYLVTLPGTRFWPQFQVEAAPGAARTFFVAAQGYYTEWIRRTWLDDPPGAKEAYAPFVASDSTLYEAMQRWKKVKPAFEAQFETSKIPVR